MLLKKAIKGKCIVLPYNFRYYVGFTISNEDGEHIAFSYHDGQLCCEDFNVNWVGVEDIEDFYNMTFNNPKIEIDHEDTEDGGFVIFRIFDKTKRIVCTVRNEHNGYYAHEVFIEENKELVHELLL